MKGAQNCLERLRGIPSPTGHPRSGETRAAAPENVTTLTREMLASICIGPSDGVQ